MPTENPTEQMAAADILKQLDGNEKLDVAGILGTAKSFVPTLVEAKQFARRLLPRTISGGFPWRAMAVSKRLYDSIGDLVFFLNESAVSKNDAGEWEEMGEDRTRALIDEFIPYLKDLGVKKVEVADGDELEEQEKKNDSNMERMMTSMEAVMLRQTDVMEKLYLDGGGENQQEQGAGKGPGFWNTRQSPNPMFRKSAKTGAEEREQPKPRSFFSSGAGLGKGAGTYTVPDSAVELDRHRWERREWAPGGASGQDNQ